MFRILSYVPVNFQFSRAQSGGSPQRRSFCKEKCPQVLAVSHVTYKYLLSSFHSQRRAGFHPLHRTNPATGRLHGGPARKNSLTGVPDTHYRKLTRGVASDGSTRPSQLHQTHQTIYFGEVPKCAFSRECRSPTSSHLVVAHQEAKKLHRFSVALVPLPLLHDAPHELRHLVCNG